MDAAAAAQASSGLRVLTYRLDVCSTDEIQTFADTLAKRHGGVDIVVSSAAARITHEQPASQQVRTFVVTNNLGTTWTPSLRRRYEQA